MLGLVAAYFVGRSDGARVALTPRPRPRPIDLNSRDPRYHFNAEIRAQEDARRGRKRDY